MDPIDSADWYRPAIAINDQLLLSIDEEKIRCVESPRITCLLQTEDMPIWTQKLPQVCRTNGMSRLSDYLVTCTVLPVPISTMKTQFIIRLKCNFPRFLINAIIHIFHLILTSFDRHNFVSYNYKHKISLCLRSNMCSKKPSSHVYFSQNSSLGGVSAYYLPIRIFVLTG